MPLLALTRPVPPNVGDCELTHLERQPIDWRRATEQHDVYEAALRSLGCEVRRLDGVPQQPDSVFIEDTAIVLDELAIIARPGAESRRGEIAGVAAALTEYRDVSCIEAPATLDGGDVLRVGRRLYVGLSTRSNQEAVDQLSAITKPFGYTVTSVVPRDCLHLKTAVSTLPDDRLLLNPRMVEASALGGAPYIEVDVAEPHAANVLSVGSTILAPASTPRTRKKLESLGYVVVSVDASELAKAEGGLTCCSLLLRV